MRKWLVLTGLGAALLPLAAPGYAGPFGSFNPSRQIINAVQSNIRQAFKPTFTIRSRHAVEMKNVVFSPRMEDGLRRRRPMVQSISGRPPPGKK
ncbi:MAG: hypothetical protein HQL62_05480 [Magnetococcales bacterium]|nr:hypothetical protein [Magnetococcales bacterium]